MGRRSNKDISSENQEEFVSQLTASTPEGRENEMIMLAYQEVERRIRDHTATSQELCHFLKMGSDKERREREKLEVEMELQRVKADAIESSKHMEELYNNAIAAMKLYSGGIQEDE
jgi:hypothetical protein